MPAPGLITGSFLCRFLSLIKAESQRGGLLNMRLLNSARALPELKCVVGGMTAISKEKEKSAREVGNDIEVRKESQRKRSCSSYAVYNRGCDKKESSPVKYLQDHQPALPCNLTPGDHGQSVPCRSRKDLSDGLGYKSNAPR